MNEVFDEIKKAVKRASYFSQKLKWTGTFSPAGKNGISIIVRNYTWLMQLSDDRKSVNQFWAVSEEGAEQDLINFYYMAKGINKYIDGHMIEGNEEDIWGLASFLSWLWFDVEKLYS